MIEQKRLLFWMLLSSALHMTILAWLPKPAILVPPRPIYLVVDLTARPTPLAGAGGLAAVKAESDRSVPSAGLVTQPAGGSNSAQQPERQLIAVRPAPHRSHPTTCMEKAGQPDDLSPPQTAGATSPNVQRDWPQEPATAKEMETPPSSEPKNAPRQVKGMGVPESILKGNLLTENTYSTSASGGSGSSVALPIAYGTNPPPPYPVAARRRGWEGEVLLRIDVTAGGSVRKVSIEKSSGFSILDEAARNAVYRWRFQPAHLNGRPVPGQVMVPVRFNLKEPR